MRVGNKSYTKISPIDYNKDVQAYCRKKGEMYGKPNKQSGAYQMGVQVPHRVYSEIPQESNLQSAAGRHKGYNPNTVQVQGSRNYRRKYDAGSRASAVKYTTENECVKFHGILERKECTADL